MRVKKKMNVWKEKDNMRDGKEREKKRKRDY